MQITDIKVRKLFEEGPMKAIVSVTFDGQLAVHDIKVINAAYIVLSELVTEFFHIPEIEKNKVDQPDEKEDEGEQPKN